MSLREVIIGNYSCVTMTARNGWKCLARFVPGLTGWFTLITINKKFVDPSPAVKDGDEIAFFPKL